MTTTGILKKIISGGQTGVDQAALQAAIDAGVEHGGWCPPGRVCENGVIPKQFKLKETPQERDPSAPDIPRSQRTIWNVRDSDGALIFPGSETRKDKGTGLAINTAIKLGKPFLVVNLNHSDRNRLSENDSIKSIQKWIKENDIQVLSVGGPSESDYPGIYERVYRVLSKLLFRN